MYCLTLHGSTLIRWALLCIALYKSGMGSKRKRDSEGSCWDDMSGTSTYKYHNPQMWHVFVGPRRVAKVYAETQIWGPESPRHGTHQTINLHQKVSTKHMCFSVESGPRRTETHAGAIRHSPSTVKTDIKSLPKTKMRKKTSDFCHRDQNLMNFPLKIHTKTDTKE